jgi:DNA-binding NtrC family response regulator
MSGAVSRLRNVRIMILEDDPLLALDLEDMLTDLGATVVGPASSVEQALRHVEEGIDAAVLDLNLRGVYSFPVIDKLQRDGTPFVVCSGYAELPETRERLRTARVLPKPCDFEKLAGLLVEQLEEQPWNCQSASGKRISATSPVGA